MYVITLKMPVYNLSSSAGKPVCITGASSKGSDQLAHFQSDLIICFSHKASMDTKLSK